MFAEPIEVSIRPEGPDRMALEFRQSQWPYARDVASRLRVPSDLSLLEHSLHVVDDVRPAFEEESERETENRASWRGAVAHSRPPDISSWICYVSFSVAGGGGLVLRAAIRELGERHKEKKFRLTWKEGEITADGHSVEDVERILRAVEAALPDLGEGQEQGPDAD